MSDESEFDCGEDVLEEEDICEYNGEQCIGDRLFCEECSVFCLACSVLTERENRKGKPE